MTTSTPASTPTDHANILNAAQRAFTRLGLDGTRLSDITRTVGLRKRAIRQQFGGKDGLFAATALRTFGAVERLIGEADSIADLSWQERIGSLVRTHLEACMLPEGVFEPDVPVDVAQVSDGALVGWVFGYTELLALVRERALRDEACEQLLTDHLDVLADRYAQHIPAEAVAPDEPKDVARGLLCFIFGIASVSGNVGGALAPEGAARLVTCVLQMIEQRSRGEADESVPVQEVAPAPSDAGPTEESLRTMRAQHARELAQHQALIGQSVEHALAVAKSCNDHMHEAQLRAMMFDQKLADHMAAGLAEVVDSAEQLRRVRQALRCHAGELAVELTAVQSSGPRRAAKAGGQ